MDTDSHDTNLLAAHLEGRLGEQESALLIAHLAECAECRATLAGFARASSRPGARGVGGLLASPPFSRPAVWLPIAAMVAIGTVAGVVTLRLNPPDRASPASESASAQAPPIAVDLKPTVGDSAPSVLPAAGGSRQSRRHGAPPEADRRTNGRRQGLSSRGGRVDRYVVRPPRAAARRRGSDGRGTGGAARAHPCTSTVCGPGRQGPRRARGDGLSNRPGQRGSPVSMKPAHSAGCGNRRLAASRA